jgi:hypothetical protein
MLASVARARRDKAKSQAPGGAQQRGGHDGAVEHHDLAHERRRGEGPGLRQELSQAVG